MAIQAAEIEALYGKYLACEGKVSTDSRNVIPGGLFFALRGGNFDGNGFVIDALKAGAAYAVSDNIVPVWEAAGDDFDTYTARIIEVNDVLEALQQLAAHHRRQLDIPVLAITGSNGKTTTKELTARVLSRKYNVSVTKGNLNNHIGVPLTLLAMDSSTGFAVVEMGASAPGEIATLCRIAQPGYGLITNIGFAHLEGFGSIDGVRRGKGELVDYLASNGGVFFYREQDSVLRDMAARKKLLKKEAYDEALGSLSNNLAGEYNRQNIAAAAAIGRYFGVPQQDIAEAVAGYTPDNNRSQIVITGRNRLIADCYNANPSSMHMAIANMALPQPEPYQARTLILGDMLEMGYYSAMMHIDVLRQVCDMGFDDVYFVGALFRNAAESFIRSTAEYAKSNGGQDDLSHEGCICVIDGNGKVARKIYPHIFDSATQLAEYIRQHPIQNRTILIKGSRGIKLEEVIPLL